MTISAVIADLINARIGIWNSANGKTFIVIVNECTGRGNVHYAIGNFKEELRLSDIEQCGNTKMLR